MTLNGYTRAVFAVLVGCAGVWGQTVAGSLAGTVVDPAGVFVSGAPVTLTSAETGADWSATTDKSGSYRFVNVEAGTYVVSVKQAGFKVEVETGITVLAQQARNAGRITLHAGTLTDVSSTPAAVFAAQTGDSAKSFVIDSDDLETLTRKGRDLFDYMRLVPGVVDTQTNRDVPSSDSLAGITINGNTSGINYNVDGITALDTGTNERVQVEPNLDSIQEISVLTANYQAEYGRNSGGLITVITKSGSQDFHGSASWNHRNEEFNANSWANNHTLVNGGAAPRAVYRYNVETYGIGGPVYIPKVANQDKKKLFFFFSQERTAQSVPAPSQITYMPTTTERGGDFSQTFTNVNGNSVSIPILDPLNGNTQFSGNVIPLSRISPVGQGLIGYFPTPNFTPTQPNQLYVDNYFEQGSNKYERRNDMLRVDSALTPKITANVRWMNDHEITNDLFKGVQFNQAAGSNALTQNISPISHPSPGRGYAVSISDAISPTTINEIRVGKSWSEPEWLTIDNYASEVRTLEPTLPTLFPVPTSASNGVVSPTNGYLDLLPAFVFGGNGLPSPSYYLRNSISAGAAQEVNNYWTLEDNFSKVIGHHALKAGFYGERNTRIQPAGQNYDGAFNFAADATNPFVNTNDGYVNALLGNVNTYSQYTATTTSNILYYNAEFYIQDSWKVNRRLTIDLGVRFYHEGSPTDHDGTFSNFIPSDYNKSTASRLYYPYCTNNLTTCSTAANGLVARDRLTGAIVGSGYIGDIVYGSGNPISGMTPLGRSTAPYQQPALSYGPRFGFAWDVFGDGKTAVRGGWGLYRNRLADSTVYGLAGQAPLSYQQTVSSVTFAQIAAANTGSDPVINNVTFAPVSAYSFPTSIPSQGVGNGSLGVQHLFGETTLVDLGYMLNYSFKQYLTYNLNYIPIGTSWPFNSANLNPTTSGATSADIGSIFERSLYPGYGAITGAAFVGSSNYNAVTARVRKQISHGLAATVAYTWSQANGITTYSPEVSNNAAYNYGRLASDRRHNLQVAYVYNIPDFAGKLGFKKLAYVTSHWQLSGIASIQSGAPFDPTCAVTTGQPAPASYTGTPDLTARCNVVGNPYSNVAANSNGSVYFNGSAFALPALATGPNASIVGPAVLGNLGGGAGVLSLPHTTNVDITATKSIPIFGSEKYILKLQVQAYNVFNHTEVSGVNSAIQFNATNNVVSNPSGVGNVSSTFPNRILEFSARFVF